MFIPKIFRMENSQEIVNFINEYPFASVVTISNNRPIATHIPVDLIEENGVQYIYGHMAKANPQWEFFESTDETLIIFNGPHAYVSASWYAHENVPTWNYETIHIYGKTFLLKQTELEEYLKYLLERYENGRDQATYWNSLSVQTHKQVLSIVGFKVRITEIQAAYKMSQNRNKKDYDNVIDQLNNEEYYDSKKIASEMNRLRSEQK